MPRTVAELDMSNNPIVSPADDARSSLFVRMLSDDAYARHITSLNLTRLGLRVVPDAVPACRRLVSLQLAYNRITVSVCRLSFFRKCASGCLIRAKTHRQQAARVQLRLTIKNCGEKQPTGIRSLRTGVRFGKTD